MRAAIEKEHGTELGLALAAAAMVMTMVLSRTEVFGSEPAADGFAAQVDSELLGQSLGEVGEVEVEAVFAVDAGDPLLQVTGLGVNWGAAVVAVADAIGTVTADVGLEAEDLAAAQAEHLGGHGSTECRHHGLLNHAVAFHVLLRVADWLWHAASIPAYTPGYDIIALPLAYDIIALRPQLSNLLLDTDNSSG
jgi:hypothetical protein